MSVRDQHRAGGRLERGLLAGLLAALSGCPNGGGGPQPPVFNNTTDPTNGNASYVGSAACGACHTNIHALNALHGHTQALKKIESEAPSYPAAGTRAGVPNPPSGKTWDDVSYVIGGYTHGAFFVDANGYVMTDGIAGVNTQWNLSFPPSGTMAGFAAYRPVQAEPLAYAYDCFRCHTTGPQAFDVADPRNQDGRPGIRGTWAEAGVTCEACHGPGSNHLPNPTARLQFVDPTTQTCGRCHLAGDDADVILASDGYVNQNTQLAELRASGGHADFTCTICHDPHASTVYDRTSGIRNECASCHTDMNMASHSGKVFTRGDYVEPLTCGSCHMPFAGRSSTSADPSIVGTLGRMGDIRGHIFRIDTVNSDYTAMFSADGTHVNKDTLGRAAVTVDFVCLRCHTDSMAVENSAFPFTLEEARLAAPRLHSAPQ